MEDKWWYIVAGGPSLIGFDWSLLQDKNCIAVNRSFEKMPYAKYVYFTDRRFWLWFGDKLKAHPGIKVSGGKFTDSDILSYKFTGVSGLETRRGLLKHGNNSGYAAINLAYHLGATNIVLLGYDMTFTGKQTHWHDGYQTDNTQKMLDKMVGYFPQLKKELGNRGVLVYNTSLISRITCFPKVPLEELLYIESITS